MKIAYLISASKDPEHLQRLVRALDRNADFYVHVDTKSNIEPYKTLLDGKVTFVRRHKVKWGTWSQVEYQVELLQTALNSGTEYKRLVFLSGQDYPLWKAEKIDEFFENNETEYILGCKIIDAGSESQRNRLFRYYLWHLIKLPLLKKCPYTYIDGKIADIYKGGDWFAITPQCGRYILKTLKSNPKMCRWFKLSFAPSENCFHTIVFNSPFAQKALLHEGKYPGLAGLTPLHMIDYSTVIKVWTETDYRFLMESGKMFVRKIVIGKSDKLVEMIDNQ